MDNELNAKKQNISKQIKNERKTKYAKYLSDKEKLQIELSSNIACNNLYKDDEKFYNKTSENMNCFEGCEQSHFKNIKEIDDISNIKCFQDCDPYYKQYLINYINCQYLKRKRLEPGIKIQDIVDELANML